MIAGMVCLLLNKKNAERLCMLALIISTVSSAALFISLRQTNESFVFSMGHFPAPWGNELHAGAFEALMALTLSIVMLLSLLAGRERITADLEAFRQNMYYLICCILTSAVMAVIYTNDIFTAYVFMEIIMLAACAMIAAKNSGAAIVATVRYLVMSLLASGMILIGISLLYAITGHLLMHDILAVMTQLAASGEYNFSCMIIMLLFSTGLAIKSGLFPFHTWLPPAYGYSAAPTSAILSGIVSKGYILLMLKIFYRIFGLSFATDLQVKWMLFVFGALGMIIGSLYAVREKNLKKRLAYSSVSHVGFIYMGIGLATEIAMVAACFHMIAHAITKPLLFLSAEGLMDVSGRSTDIYSMQFAGRRNILAGVGFFLGSLSMIGIPLFPGFVSKLYFVQGSFMSPDRMLITLIFLVVSTVLTAMYYIPVLSSIYITSDKESPYKLQRHQNTWQYKIAIGAFIFVCFLVGIFFEPVIHALEQGLLLF